MPSIDWLRFTRRALTIFLCAALVLLLAIAALSHFIPMSGRGIYIIRGGSMSPTIPLGSVIAVRTVPAVEIGPGDVVTLRTATGVIVTHRVVSVANTTDGSLQLTTRGDANAFADLPAWPATALVGRVDFWVPYAGYVLALVSTTSGLVSVLSGLGALLLAIWSLQEAEDDRRIWRQGALDPVASS